MLERLGENLQRGDQPLLIALSSIGVCAPWVGKGDSKYPCRLISIQGIMRLTGLQNVTRLVKQLNRLEQFGYIKSQTVYGGIWYGITVEAWQVIDDMQDRVIALNCLSNQRMFTE
jgi:hypothetical protein